MCAKVGRDESIHRMCTECNIGSFIVPSLVEAETRPLNVSIRKLLWRDK